MALPLVHPTLNYPFTTRVSPFAADADEQCYRWGERMGIYHLGDPDRYRRTRVGWLAGYTSPDSTRTGLQLLADWQMWLFAFDDGFCDESDHGRHPEAMVRRTVSLLGVLEGGLSRAADPFGVALRDLRTRLASCATGVQRARFVSAVTAYFMAQCWESVGRATGTLPGVHEYLHMRRHSGAVRTCTALIDVAGGFQLPAEEYDRPDVVSLTMMAVDVTCWANDIVSYPKETLRSRTVHSLPVVLARQRDADPDRMIGTAVRMHDRQVVRYLSAERRVRARAGAGLRRYLDGLRFWMAGNLCWSRSTGRYRTGPPG
jgi:terpene synthase-like protein